jgi:uncharacterized protein YraI
METLAFIHHATAYEDPNPEPQLTLLDGNSVCHSAVVGLTGVVATAVLLAGSPTKADASPTSIGAGSQGEAIANLQEALGIEADGKYGSQTEAAVMDFQIRQGLKVDGVAGKETAKALGLDEKYSPIGYVVTNSGIGLNIRRGPGLNYRIMGAVPDGFYLDQIRENVIYNDGYRWVQVVDPYSGRIGWSASRYLDDYYSRPVAYYDNDYYDCYRHRPVVYYNDCYRRSYYSRPVAYYYDCGRYY